MHSVWKSGSSSQGGPGKRIMTFGSPSIFGRHELAGSRAPRIAQHLRALDEIGLAGVVRRHLNAAGGEAGVERGQNVGIAPQAEAERFRHALAREVVLGRPESAGADQDLGPRQGLLDTLNQAFTVVAHDGFENHFDAQVVQLLGEKEGVGVLAVWRQHFGADRDDLCVHSKQCSKTRLFVPDSLWCRPSRKRILRKDCGKPGKAACVLLPSVVVLYLTAQSRRMEGAVRIAAAKATSVDAGQLSLWTDKPMNKPGLALLSVLLLSTVSSAQDSRAMATRVWRQANERAIVTELMALVSIPDLAADPASLRKNATTIQQMLEKRGVKTRLLETPDAPPAVYGELITPGASRTPDVLRALRWPAA